MWVKTAYLTMYWFAIWKTYEILGWSFELFWRIIFGG